MYPGTTWVQDLLGNQIYRTKTLMYLPLVNGAGTIGVKLTRAASQNYFPR